MFCIYRTNTEPYRTITEPSVCISDGSVYTEPLAGSTELCLFESLDGGLQCTMPAIYQAQRKLSDIVKVTHSSVHMADMSKCSGPCETINIVRMSSVMTEASDSLLV